MLDNCQLIHPVHERMTFFNNTLKFTIDAGNQFISGKQVGGIHRHRLGTQKVCLDPVFLELGPFNKPASSSSFLTIREHLRLVNPEFLPEFALEDTLGFRLNQFQCFINRICHCCPPFCPSDKRCNCKDIITPDHDSAKASSPLVIDKLDRLFHVDIQVLIHGDEAPLQFLGLRL